jgi:TRAP-type C4-dicarboxylate transport system permease small subunit
VTPDQEVDGAAATGRLKQALDRVLAAASIVLFVLLVVIVAWQVVTRQIIKDPSAWSEEAARYTFVWLGFFATALVFSERGHIAVDLDHSRRC